MPCLKDADVGMSWLLGNLFREFMMPHGRTYRMQSPYKALTKAKRKYPIPTEAFFAAPDVSLVSSASAQTSSLPRATSKPRA